MFALRVLSTDLLLHFLGAALQFPAYSPGTQNMCALQAHAIRSQAGTCHVLCNTVCSICTCAYSSGRCVQSLCCLNRLQRLPVRSMTSLRKAETHYSLRFSAIISGSTSGINDQFKKVSITLKVAPCIRYFPVTGLCLCIRV